MGRDLNTHKKNDTYSTIIKEGEEEMYREKSGLTSMCKFFFSTFLKLLGIAGGVLLVVVIILILNGIKSDEINKIAPWIIGIGFAIIIGFIGRLILNYKYCPWCKHYFCTYNSSGENIVDTTTTPISRSYTTTETVTNWRGEEYEKQITHTRHGERRTYYYTYRTTCRCCGLEEEIYTHRSEDVFFD